MHEGLTTIEPMADPKHPYPDVAQRVRVLMAMAGTNKVKDFAKLLGIESNRLSNYLSGMSRPPAEVMRTIKDLFKVPPDWVLWGDEDGLTLQVQRDLRAAAENARQDDKG